MFFRRWNSWKEFWIFLALYATCLFLLLPKLSLWLDEIIDLRAIRDFSLPKLIAFVPTNSGGVPLSYLAQFTTVHLLGFSSFSGRLSSALFSLAGCVGVFIMGRRLKLRLPLLAVVIFAILPLQLRYALESRPYSGALALSIWATVLFFGLIDEPKFWRALLYGLIALAGLYTQPYTIFVFLGHLGWLCFWGAQPNKTRLLILTAVPIVVAVLGFLPWYFWTIHLWNESVTISHVRFKIGLRAVPLVLRELTGAGYPGTVAIAALAWIGLRRGLSNNKSRIFWGIYAAAPILLVLLADAIFGYFLAIRQMIFVLAPLSLLAALGIENVGGKEKRQSWRFTGGILLTVILLFGDVHYFRKPRENWRSASKILQHLAVQGSCVIFVPSDSAEFYGFFAPQLLTHTCSSNTAELSSVALAISPYGSIQAYRDEVNRLSRSGFSKGAEWNPQGPQIEIYNKRAY